MKKNNEKGFTLIEVLISLIICIIIFMSDIYLTYQQGGNQINEKIAKKAIAHITSECEYWQSKITTQNVTDRDMRGYINNPYKVVALDSVRGINGYLYLEPIDKIDMIETIMSPDFFKIDVIMEWVDVDSQLHIEKLNCVSLNKI